MGSASKPFHDWLRWLVRERGRRETVPVGWVDLLRQDTVKNKQREEKFFGVSSLRTDPSVPDPRYGLRVSYVAYTSMMLNSDVGLMQRLVGSEQGCWRSASHHDSSLDLRYFRHGRNERPHTSSRVYCNSPADCRGRRLTT